MPETNIIYAALTGESGGSDLNAYAAQVGDVAAVFVRRESTSRLISTGASGTYRKGRTGDGAGEDTYLSTTALSGTVVTGHTCLIAGTVRVASLPTASGSAYVAGVEFGVVDVNNYGTIRLLSLGSGSATTSKLQIIAIVGGVEQAALYDATVALTAGQTYRIALQVLAGGSTADVYLNGAKQNGSTPIALTGVTTAGNKIGLVIYHDSAGSAAPADDTGLQLTRIRAAQDASPATDFDPVVPEPDPIVVPPTDTAPQARPAAGGRLTRSANGRLLREEFASLARWYNGDSQAWSADTTRPCYAAYPSQIPMISPRAIGQPDGGGIRESQVTVLSDGRWFMIYGAGDGTSGVNGPWRVMAAISSDKGVTWDRSVGTLVGLAKGNPSEPGGNGANWYARDVGGYLTQGPDSKWYLVVLDAHNPSGGSPPNIPGSPYADSIYRADAPEGPYAYVGPGVGLGASGSFDEGVGQVGWVNLISGTYHFWYSAGNGGGGHATASSLAGPPVKDGQQSVMPSDLFGGAKGLGENPKVWYSAALGRWTLQMNFINAAGIYTNANDQLYNTTFNNLFRTGGTYKIRSQKESVMDSVDSSGNPAAVGLACPIVTPNLTPIEDSAGRIGFTYDADPPSMVDSANHILRRIRQGAWEPSPSRLRFNRASGSTRRHIATALSHTDCVFEFVLQAGSTGGTGLRFEYRRAGTTTAGADTYIVEVASGANPVLKRSVGGTVTTIASATASIVAGDMAGNNHELYRVKIIAEGNRHRVIVDGKTVIDFTDSGGSVIASGTAIGYSATTGDYSIRLLSAYAASASVTVSAPDATAGSTVRLRGPGGIVVASGALTAGSVTLSSWHYPATGIEVDGVLLPATGDVYGGDALQVAAFQPNPDPEPLERPVLQSATIETDGRTLTVQTDIPTIGGSVYVSRIADITKQRYRVPLLGGRGTMVRTGQIPIQVYQEQTYTYEYDPQNGDLRPVGADRNNDDLEPLSFAGRAVTNESEIPVPPKIDYSSGGDSFASWLAVTPDDEDDLLYPQPRAVGVAVSGNVSCVDKRGNSAVHYVTAGMPLAISPQRVLATGTTATGIVAYY